MDIDTWKEYKHYFIENNLSNIIMYKIKPKMIESISKKNDKLDITNTTSQKNRSS